MRFLKLSQHLIPLINISYIQQVEEPGLEDGVEVTYVTTHITLKTGEVIECNDDFEMLKKLLE